MSKNNWIRSADTFPKVKLGLCIIIATIIGVQFIISSLKIDTSGLYIEFASTDNLTVFILGVIILGMAYLDYRHFKDDKEFELKKLELLQKGAISNEVKKLINETLPEN